MTWLWVLLALLVGVHALVPAYYLLMRVAARRAAEPTRGGTPSVSIVMPVYNEAETITRRLDNLRELDYPDYHLVVADDGSKDDTVERVKAYQRAHPDFPIELLAYPGKGKAHTVRKALRHAKGDIVSVADADTIWDRRALAEAAARFADPKVGTVMGVRQLFGGDGLAGSVEEDYNEFYNTLRLGESALDSTPVFAGPLFLFRRELVPPEAYAEDSFRADDSETAIRIRKAGYRAVVEPRAHFQEASVPTLSDYRHIRARRVTGLQQLFLRNLPLIARPWRYGWFSLACAANLVMLVVAPLAAVALVALAPVALWTLGGIPALALFAVAAAGLWVLPRWIPASPATLARGYLESQWALLQGLWMLRERNNARWEHASGIRERWRQQGAA